MGRVTALRIPCGLGRALGRDTDEYLIDEICCVSTRKHAHCIAGESYKDESAPSVGSKRYLAIFRAPYLYCHPRLLISLTTPHRCLNISQSTSSSTINIDQRLFTMATDLHFCIYYANGNRSNANTKPNTTNAPSSIVYQSFLQGISNDIQRYQALQRVVCGHPACKDALMKSMQCPRAG